MVRLSRAFAMLAAAGVMSGAMATNLLVNGDFETNTVSPPLSGAADNWGNAGGLGFGNAGGWAEHAVFPAPNNGTLGKNFAYYSPQAGTELMGQIVPTERFALGYTYTFKSWATNGGNSNVVYEIGYAAIDDDKTSWVDLGKAVYTITSAWAQYDGISYTVGAGDAAIGKQIMVRFGQVGGVPAGGGAWVDSASLEAVPEPATLAVLGLGTLLAVRRRRA